MKRGVLILPLIAMALLFPLGGQAEVGTLIFQNSELSDSQCQAFLADVKKFFDDSMNRMPIWTDTEWVTPNSERVLVFPPTVCVTEAVPQ